jgi:dTMP kinase
MTDRRKEERGFQGEKPPSVRLQIKPQDFHLEKRKGKQSRYFIVFEGPEGAGKSTQIKHLVTRLNETFEVVQTREPGGTPAADAIRKVILDPALTISPLTEFLLYSASRAQHVEEVIKLALGQNKVVVCDRFFGASVAYQGYGRGLELNFIYDLTKRVTQGITPDLVLLLDIDPQAGLERIAQRGQKDRLELADISFHRKVREGFLAQARESPNWVIINAQQDEDRVREEIWQAVQNRLGVE